MANLSVLSPTKQKLLIIFTNVPPNYCVEDIIRYHFPSNSKSISNKKIEKIRRFIIAIKIDPTQRKCLIIFSSIYQWLKHSRFIKNNEKTLGISIYPKSLFDSAANCSNIALKLKYNEKIINLKHILSTSYVFHSNNSIYISFKHNKNDEYLFEIKNTEQINIHKEKQQISMLLNQQIKLYQYFHRNEYNLCKSCNSVNNKESANCISCGIKLEESLDSLLHKMKFLEIEPNMKSLQVTFINQSTFYQQSTAWNTNNGIHLLNPLYDIMKQTNNIHSSIMFSNYITLKFDRLTSKGFIHYVNEEMVNKLNITLNEIQQNEIIHSLDYNKQFEEIKNSIMNWLKSEIGSKYIFPIIAKLLHFKNPSSFADVDVIEDFLGEIEEQFDQMCVPEWILQEVIMKLKCFDVEQLKIMIEETLHKYEEEGIDIDHPKQNYFQIKISRFSININMMDLKELKQYQNFNDFTNKIKKNVYITTFENGLFGPYDIFKNIRNIMNFNGFQFIFEQEDLFLRLNSNNDTQISYISTVCDEYFSYDDFREKFKKIDYLKDVEDDEDNEIYKVEPIWNALDAHDMDMKHQEPPIKKRKINAIKTEKIYIDNAYSTSLNEDNGTIDSVSNINAQSEIETKLESKEAENIQTEPEPKTEIVEDKPKSIVSESKPDTKDIIDDKAEIASESKPDIKKVYISDGVPIYNAFYYDCSVKHLWPSSEFDLGRFALQCIATACRTDICSTQGRGALRNIGNRVRNRVLRKPDEAEAAFFNIPDDDYNELFISCFTKDKDKMLDIDLKKYKKRRRKYIIYRKGYGIDKDKINTLKTLLNLYDKYNTIGVLKLDEYAPPWYKPNITNDDELVEQLLNLKVDIIDLTNMELDDDDDNYGKERMDHVNMQNKVKRNGVKMEYEYETSSLSSDSESD